MSIAALNLIKSITLPTTTSVGNLINPGSDGFRLGQKIFVKKMHWAIRFTPTAGGVAEYVKNANPPTEYL